MITPELSQLIADAIEDRLTDVHTALPGKIQSYDAANKSADIELQIKRPVPREGGGWLLETLPVLPNVPVRPMMNSRFFVSMAPGVGDVGLVLFTEMSIDQWRKTNRLASPGEIGRHDLSGGVFIPFLVAEEDADFSAPADAIAVGHIGGAKLSVKSNDDIEMTNNSTGFVRFRSNGQLVVNNNFTVDV